MGDLKGDIMAYADDLACWSEEKNKLTEILHCFYQCLREMGLSMNTEKTETVVVSREDERRLIVNK